METCEQVLAVGQFLQAKEQSSRQLTVHRKMLVAYRDKSLVLSNKLINVELPP